MTFRLAEPEARALEGFCGRQLRWDSALPARVVTSTKALGVFTSPPLGVIVFVAVPTVEPIDQADQLDVTVPLERLAAALRSTGQSGLDVAGLPRAMVPVGLQPSLTHLPPTDGWQLPIFGIAGDLVPLVDAATAEFDARAGGLSARGQQTIADEIWDRPGFGGLPLRALHAARQLGMLTSDRAKVSAATSGPWKRLSTSRGQVFVYATGPSARLSLRVVH
ncbi:MAG: hypothetical protein NTX29_05925 [Actinobacteria bacterium]|nr:hypothetical protein [Actinomycetota bacterium]